MEKEIYLDNSATTPVCKAAIDNAVFAMSEEWGNPSALYTRGMNAEALVSKARERVADYINARPDEIFFTGCGTESNNTAIFGAVEKLRKRCNRVVTSIVEHPSVKEPMKKLQEQGVEVIYLPVNSEGKVSVDHLREAINEKTMLVSLMAVNNETGAIQPVDKVREIIKEKNSPALFHCDAVQGFGKLPLDVNRLGVDLLSISGHKVHAPKGVGVLYKKKGLALPSYLLGGGQEKGFRSGTEAVPLIWALKGAVDELGNPRETLPHIVDLNRYAREKLTAIDGVYINSPEDALPYILNISVTGYRSEILLHFLEARGVYVSSGSACSKGMQSGVLGEMGLPATRGDSALRISMSRHTTREDIDGLAEGLNAAKAKLRRVK